MSFGHVSFVSPGGRFCGSLRQSGAPSELPQIFQVAVDLRSWSLNQAFWVAPRIVCGGTASIKNLGRIFWEHPGEFRTKAADSFITEGIGAAVTMLVGDDEIEMPTGAIGAIADQAVDRREIVGLD